MQREPSMPGTARSAPYVGTRPQGRSSSAAADVGAPIPADHDTTPPHLASALERDRAVVAGWNATGVAFPSGATLVGLFEAQVAASPEAVAVVDAQTVLTYGQFNSRVNRLAGWLRGVGVGAGTLVGVHLQRGVDLLTAVYAVVKAGGAYLPLEPELPAERLRFMIAEAALPVVLTEYDLRERLTGLLTGAGLTARVVAVDTDFETVTAGQPETDPEPVAGPDDLAYVIYTSGSTGRPKGVMNTHRGICNRLLWMQDHFALDHTDRVLHKTPSSFDVSVWELFWPLQTGAQLVIAAPGGHRDPGYLIQTITRQHITTIHFVPSMLRLFLDHDRAHTATSLRRVICSGETLTSDLQHRFFDRLHCQLHNLYGPTEAAVDVTAWHCQPDDHRTIVPIGRPIANTTIHILDDHDHPTPIGVPGELHIGGVQVARGYLHRPDLTAQRFIPDPFDPHPHARLYRTGDLARWLPDGTLHYLGRTDLQVKLHGVRIELEEIETTLRTHPAINDTAVILTDDRVGDERLVAYVVPAGAAAPDSRELRAHLRERLPVAMVPSTFVVLEALPLTASGKVDRKALPAAEAAADSRREADYIAPRTTVEREIATLWEAVLGVARVGMYDDFFDLGGYSLKAMQAISRIRDTYGVELSLLALFEEPTVAGQAEFVSEALAVAEDDEALLELIHAIEAETDDAR